MPFVLLLFLVLVFFFLVLVLFFCFIIIIFSNTVLTWKIVGASKVSVLYRYIDNLKHISYINSFEWHY